MDSLIGKTAVVTGAASGMGLAMSQRFVEAGMNVVLSDIDENKLTEATRSITASGGRAIGVLADVALESDHSMLLDRAIDEFGIVNVVCLNAGVTGSVGRSWTLAKQDWDWTLGILLDGVINGIRTFVPHLIDHGDGHVVTTASIAGHVSSPYAGPYNVGKHGVVTLSETLHHELKADGSSVGVTCLCPGFVSTNIVQATRERNSDEAGSGKDEKGDRWLEISERVLRSGLEPEVVAQQVHDAILENQFWLFTDNDWDSPIARRNKEIVERNVPSIGLPDLK
jgi:NAD(P)-dependent dehydrogenase (short-subunit alcohol dehydrogenase family)|tara:strand:- start:7327 stop:8172 length:846 start_codon:yes stop_codon:yes gene_type:complete